MSNTICQAYDATIDKIMDNTQKVLSTVPAHRIQMPANI